ncbi:MAG: NAD-dependent epimerase/dehydratase family protein [Thermoanaerobaculia bacterium]
MRIFLTGATGYIGSALCRRLARQGHELRALVRSTSRVEELRSLDVRLFEGDITDRYSMREGMSGADWVVHAAAELDFEASLDRMRPVNAEGSHNVASLANKLGAGRFLSISSIARYGGSPADGSPATEESPLQLPLPSNYSLTKHEGELAIQHQAEQGLKVNTVFPSLVYGPPVKGQGANTLLKALVRGRLPVVAGADRKTTWIYLEDLVEGILRVMERAEPGRNYLLTGEMVRIGDLVERVCGLAGVGVPRWRLSVAAARALTALTAPLYRWRGRRPSPSPEQLKSLARHWNFDDTRARTELDWKPRRLQEGLPPTVAALERS